MGIKVVVGAYGTVKEVVEKYKKGELKEASGPTVGPHFGAGRGMGRGYGRRWWSW
jgi:predicted Fe-Mo cluster-binding NifX family protein